MKPTETPFLGIAYTLRSQTLADQRLINLYPEIVEGKSGSAAVGGLYGCPGLDLVTTVGDGPIRGMLAQGGGVTVVSGAGVHVLDEFYGQTFLGNMTTHVGQVSMVNNRTQAAIFDSVGGWLSNGAFLSPITLPFTGPPGVATYLDGFGILTQPGTFNIWQSNLNDLATWDPLNFTTEDGTADSVVSVLEFHNQFAVMKQTHMCFYINAGLPGFAFQRLQGVYAEQGILAPYCLCEIDESLIWLGQNVHGGRSVYLMRGYEPERVSTHAMEYAIGQYDEVDDAIAFTYQQEGHKFYVITFPTGNATWVLDLTETRKIGVPCWHERASFANGLFGRYAANCFAHFNGALLVGDYQSGNIYRLNLDSYTDNGSPRKWLRSWRATGKSQYGPRRYNFLELNYESGIGMPPDSNPQFVLRYSDDSYNWSSELFGDAGRIGETGAIARWNRLGMTRRGVNSDRIFELSSTDPFKVALLGATIG